MTLALYGKSRRRQGGLLLAGFVALMIAVIGGVASIDSAFAHNRNASATCTTATVNFTAFAGGTNSAEVKIALDDGAFSTYYPQWSGASYVFNQAIAPANKVVIDVRWGPGIGVGTSDNHSSNPAAQTFDNLDCNDEAKIIIRKYVPDGISGTSTVFTADIFKKGVLVADDVQFSEDPGSPGSYTYTFPVTTGDGTGSGDLDDYSVVENVPAGWAASYWLDDGNDSCASGGDHSFSAGNTASGGDLNDLDDDDVVTVCFKNERLPDPPTVTKSAFTDTTSDPNAIFFNIVITNPASGQDVDVAIKDADASYVSYSGSGSCDTSGSGFTDGDLNDDDNVCNLDDGESVTIKVKKVITAPRQCEDLQVQNTAQFKWRNEGGSYNSYADTNTATVTLLGDPSLCNEPGITKTHTGPTSTSNPADVSWTVEVKNPASGTGVQQTVWIKDSNVVVVSGPTFTGTADCDENTNPAFQNELNDADGVECSMPNNSTIRFVVQPAGDIARTCEDQKFNNTAYLYVGSTDSDPITANGEEITLLGDESLCSSEIRVCKIIEDNGDGDADNGLFGGDIRASTNPNAVGPLADSGNDFNFPEQQEGEGRDPRDACVTISVPKGGSFELVEWKKPLDWDDAAGYPKYQVDNGPILSTSDNTTGIIKQIDVTDVVFLINKSEPSDREIIIEKRFVDLPEGFTPDVSDYPTIEINDPNYPNVTFANNCSWVTNNTADHVFALCTVPFDWAGTIDETPPPGWAEVDCVERVVFDLRIEAITVAEPDEIFCNAPFGTVIVNKINTSASGPNFEAVISGLPAQSVTGAALDGSPTIAQGSPSNQTYVPLGNTPFSVTETNAGTIETCGSGATNYFTIVQAPADTVLDTPGEVQEWTIVNQPCGVLGQGGIVLQKFRDNNGDGVTNGSDGLIAWTFRITGPGGYDETFNLTAAQMPHLVGGLAPGNYTVSELTESGWVVIGLRVDNGALVPAATQATVAVDGALNVLRGVTFYNQPRVNIVVSKTIFNNANPAGANGGSGWTFTLNGCGIGPDQKTTDASGTVSWTNLPPAVGCSYTVTETAKAGWVADQISKSTSPDEPGETATLGFVNRQIEGCTNANNCRQPEDPTPTNTPETPETPTNTPEPDETPTEEPSETAIAGEKTPGPGDQATPIAPDTGAGISGTTSAGMNVLLIIAGLIAISGGLSFIALGRKKS